MKTSFIQAPAGDILNRKGLCVEMSDDLLMMRNGQMLILRGQQMVALGEDMVLADGTRIAVDGRVILTDGTFQALVEGQAILVENQVSA
jgi:hypothetical protein